MTNRIQSLLGVAYPVVQAPMTYIARAELAAAVSEAGGLGVIEAGLIAGFTAAGVPETAAVGATFTARMFTAYLPPIWGWFALDWLRRKEYV